jgi:hypothetical protein
MSVDYQNEVLVNKLVTYSLNLGGQMILVENVPARVNEETGEQFFAPETVEQLQELVLGEDEPSGFVEVPVYRFQQWLSE